MNAGVQTITFLLFLIPVQPIMQPMDTTSALDYYDIFNPGLNVRNCTNDSAIVDYLLAKHDKKILPGESTVKVIVEVWVQEITKIVEISSDFELDIYVTEQWVDPSLAFLDINPCKQNLSLDGGSIIKRLWTPNSCFVNSKNASIHKSPVKNIFLMIYGNGTIIINYRMKLTGPCVKDLKTFPTDKLKCSLTYESFTYNHDEVELFWSDYPVTVMREIRLPDYDFTDTDTYRAIRDYPPGLWDELTLTFVFERRYGFYILQAYVPAYMSVFLSWVSFYLGPSNVVSRTTVGVNSLLSLSFQFSSIVANLPRTSDVKAMDVLILTCMAFIFCSLLELAIVGYLQATKKKKDPECRCSWTCHHCPEWTAQKVDSFAISFFPISFTCFNIYYWGFYINVG